MSSHPILTSCQTQVYWMHFKLSKRWHVRGRTCELRSIWSFGYDMADLIRFDQQALGHVHRVFATWAAQHQRVGGPAALCGAVWPGWELEDTYLMWGSADCIVSTGRGTTVLGSFRDTKCLKQDSDRVGLLSLWEPCVTADWTKKCNLIIYSLWI